MILVIDNYDSFTFNLVQYLGELNVEMQVHRNDQIGVEEVMARHPQGIVISPGPGYPDSAGICLELINTAAGKLPILGVCLGHQAIGQAFGGKIGPAQSLMHGKTSPIRHDGKGVFSGLPQEFAATRYHSLVIERDSLPECLEVSAWTDDGEIMGVRHRELAVEGVQFHPESILTVEGKKLLDNFLSGPRKTSTSPDARS